MARRYSFPSQDEPVRLCDEAISAYLQKRGAADAFEANDLDMVWECLDSDQKGPWLSLLAKQITSNGEDHMSKKAAEHHKKVSEHLTHAARHHGEAAKHHEAGSHEKAAHHAHVARGHVIHARGYAEEAVKAHLEEHGKK